MFPKRSNPCHSVEQWHFSARGRISRRLIPSAQAHSGAARRLAGTLASIILLALASSSPFSVLAQKPASPSTTANLPAGAMQAKATTACTECHEARIIVQQRLSKAAWAKEVEKMTKWGALVDLADRDALIDYLSVNFSADQPAYEPQKTTALKAGKR